MSVATAVPTVVTSRFGDYGYKVSGTIAVDASPATYATGGITLNLNQSAVKASRTPVTVIIQGISGYDYSYIPGSDNSNGKLMIRAQSASASAGDPLAELAAAAVPAGVSSDTITFQATWKGME